MSVCLCVCFGLYGCALACVCLCVRGVVKIEPEMELRGRDPIEERGRVLELVCVGGEGFRF